MIKAIQEHKHYGKPLVNKYGSFDIKVDADSRKVSGYLAAFGNKDSDDDIIIKGAFAKSLAERGVNSSTPRKIAFLWMHNMTEPLGPFTKLHEDDTGLYFEADISKMPLGDRVLTQYADGTLNQHSIGFRYVWDKIEWDEDREAFIVKEVNLFEGSVVTMGANEETEFAGFKAEEIEEQGRLLEKQFEDFLKKLSPTEAYEARQYVSKYITLSKEEPFDKNTLKTVEPKEFNLLEAINKTNFKTFL